MPNEIKFPPGTVVKIVNGAFTDLVGVVLDPAKAVDPRGNLYPPPAAGYHWVMLTLNNSPFPAHLFQDEIQAVVKSGDSATQS